MKNIAQIKADNATILDGLTSGNNTLEKEATGILGKALVREAYEQGILRRVMPAQTVRIEDQAAQVDTLLPTYIREVRPGSVGAFSMPVGGMPGAAYMALPRYRVVCGRIGSRRLTGDVLLLKGYNDDVRKLFSDMQLRDILFAEDAQFLGLADSICGAVNSTGTTRYTLTGAKGYIELGGNMSRSTLALLDMGLVSTNANLDVGTYLTNIVTIKQYIAMDRAQIGGDLAEQILTKGVGKVNILGKEWVTTIKKGLVPNGIVYAFAENEALGDFIVVEDVTMGVETKDYFIETYAWECIGMTIANAAAVCKATFSGASAGSW